MSNRHAHSVTCGSQAAQIAVNMSVDYDAILQCQKIGDSHQDLKKIQ